MMIIEVPTLTDGYDESFSPWSILPFNYVNVVVTLPGLVPSNIEPEDQFETEAQCLTLAEPLGRTVSEAIETMLVSEDILRHDWDNPDEDLAWSDL